MQETELAKFKTKITDVVTRVTVETLNPERTTQIIGQVLELSGSQLDEYMMYHQSLLLTKNMRGLDSGYCRQTLMKQLLEDFNYELDKVFVFLNEADPQTFLNYLNDLAPAIAPTFTGHNLVGAAYESYQLSQSTEDLSLTRPQVYESVWLCTIPSGENAALKNQGAFSYAAMLITLYNWQILDVEEHTWLTDKETEYVDIITHLYRLLVSELAHQAYRQKTQPIIEYYNQYGYYTKSQVLQILAERQVIELGADGTSTRGTHLFEKNRVSEPGDVINKIPGLKPTMNLYSQRFIDRASTILTKEKEAIAQLPAHEGILADLVTEFFVGKDQNEALGARRIEYYKKIYQTAYRGEGDLTTSLAIFIGARKIYFDPGSPYQYNPLLVAQRAPLKLLLEFYEKLDLFEQQHVDANWFAVSDIVDHLIATRPELSAITSGGKKQLFFDSLTRRLNILSATKKYSENIHSSKKQNMHMIMFEDEDQTRQYVLPNNKLYIDMSDPQLLEELTNWVTKWIERNSL